MEPRTSPRRVSRSIRTARVATVSRAAACPEPARQVRAARPAICAWRLATAMVPSVMPLPDFLLSGVVMSFRLYEPYGAVANAVAPQQVHPDGPDHDVEEADHLGRYAGRRPGREGVHHRTGTTPVVPGPGRDCQGGPS